MRSHAHTPAAPLPPLFEHDTTYLPNRGSLLQRAPSLDFGAENNDEDSYGYSSDFGIPLAALDHDTSRLLQPPPRCRRSRLQHRVRIQGQLALVRSVSVANLPQPSLPNSTTAPGHHLSPSLATRSDAGIGGSGGNKALGSRTQRPRSGARVNWTGAATARATAAPTSRWSLDIEDDDEEDSELRERDTQLRGYGIGGAGNIRKFAFTTPQCLASADLRELIWAIINNRQGDQWM
ncbi:hypothetical protein PG997_005771 [Apiospora hydei]|uniref:Uncharacterized protein n=1 Tax=Apiospora hydei TaxID=1337664 RepID=A0ABR1WPU7_9PEZI